MAICGEELESDKEGSEPRVLTLQEVASYLRVHPSTISRLLKKNKLQGFKVGRGWRFNVEQIEGLWFGRKP
jgi:excisionase family DNA binding protein